MRKKLSPSKIIALQKLFNAKNWPIEENEANSTFNSFCFCMSLLDEEEQSFLIELTYNFECIGVNSFIEKICNSYKSIPQERVDKANNIFIYPLTDTFKQQKNGNIKKTGEAAFSKSSGFLYYYLDRSDIKTFQDDKIFFEDSLNEVLKGFNLESDLLILIDDFAGTGETAIKICRKFLDLELPKNKKLNSTNIIVLTIVAQKHAIKSLKKEIDIDLYAGRVDGKSISDTYTNVSERLDMMRRMEIKIGMSKDSITKYSLGYGQSEALYKIINTPNNTFPIYWSRTSKIKHPIFPRHTKNKKKRKSVS